MSTIVQTFSVKTLTSFLEYQKKKEGLLVMVSWFRHRKGDDLSTYPFI